MAHPLIFDADDPLLQRVRDIALALPGAQERISHGSPNWFTTKMFAGWRAHVKGSHDDESLARALTFLPDHDERDVLLADERFHVPAYIGHRGWLALNLAHGLPTASISTSDDKSVDWVEVAELIDMSFRNNAPARLIKELDAR